MPSAIEACPRGSKSTKSTRCCLSNASPALTLTAVVVFPVPPLWLAQVMIRVACGAVTSVTGAVFRAAMPHILVQESSSASMIKASKGKYHRRGALCTRPHTSWTGDGLPPQVCQGDSIVSSLGHRALEGVADLLILHTITAFGGVGTFQCSKEPYRCVSCSNRPRRWRTNEGECSRRTRDETVRYFMV